MKSRFLLPITLLFASVLFSCSLKNNKAKVLVVGTIHGSHSSNPHYTYQDVLNILGTYNPDVICVEIPPSYFRKRSYLKEMMIASIYGFENNKKVYPIDWWTSGDRKEQKKFRESEEYKIKGKRIEDLVKADTGKKIIEGMLFTMERSVIIL